MDPATAGIIVNGMIMAWNIIQTKGERARILLNAEVQRQTQEIDRLLAEIQHSSSSPKSQAGQDLVKLIESITLSCAVQISFRDGFDSGDRLQRAIRSLEKCILKESLSKQFSLEDEPSPFTWEDERFNDIIESILPSHWSPVPDAQDVCYKCDNVMNPINISECPPEDDGFVPFCNPRVRFLTLTHAKDQRTESWLKNNKYLDKLYYPVGYSGPLLRSDKELFAFGKALNRAFTRTNTNFHLSEYAMLLRQTRSKSKENGLMKKLHTAVRDWRAYQKNRDCKAANAAEQKIRDFERLIYHEEQYRYNNEWLHYVLDFSNADRLRVRSMSGYSNPERHLPYSPKRLGWPGEHPAHPLTGYDCSELSKSLKQEFKESGLDNKWIKKVLSDGLEAYGFPLVVTVQLLYVFLRTLRFARLEYEAMSNAEAGVDCATEKLRVTAEQKRELEDRIRVCYTLLNKGWAHANDENYKVLRLSEYERLLPFVYRSLKDKIPKKSNWSDGLQLNTPRQVLRDSLLGPVGKRVSSYKVLEVNHSMQQSIDELQAQCQFLQQYLKLNLELSRADSEPPA